MRPKRQRTVHVRIRDRESGFVLFGSIKVERTRITLNPTPGIIFAGIFTGAPVEGHEFPPFERLDARAHRLGQLLRKRWFGTEMSE